MNRLSEAQFRELHAQPKIEYIRGVFRNLQGYCEEGLLRVMRQSRPNFNQSEPDFKRILEAFILRVEDFFCLSIGGGTALDHLPQRGYITETEYNLLFAEAAHLAGVVFDHLKYDYSAAFAHAQCSRHLAKAKETADLLRKHIQV